MGAAGTLTVGGTYGVDPALGMATTVGGALRRGADWTGMEKERQIVRISATVR